MSFKSLKELRQMQQEQADRRAAGDRPKATWLSSRLGKNGDSVKFRFLQELDEDAAGYDEARGLGLIVMEHDSPWLPGSPSKHARCTMETEGQCYGCEVSVSKIEGAYKWKAKPKIYVNVLVTPEKEGDAPETMIASWRANSDVVKFLLSHAEAYDTLLNMAFKITRNGQKTDTTYTIMPLMSDKVLAQLPLDGAELYDLEQYIIKVPYEKQPEYFGAATPVAEAPSEVPSRPRATDSDEW